MANLPQIDSLGIPPEIRCSICWDIAINPVVPSTADKTNKLCRHFLCSSCEETNRTTRLDQRFEVSCPQCQQKYKAVLPDDDTARKVIDFVEKNPQKFDRKSYEELVHDRQSSIPIAIQIRNAIMQNKIDEIEGLVNEIKDEREKCRILFEILKDQVHKRNIETAKILVNFMSQTVWKGMSASIILNFYFLTQNAPKAEEYALSFPDSPLKKALLLSLVQLFQLQLSPTNNAPLMSPGIPFPLPEMPEEQKKDLFLKIVSLINMVKKQPSMNSHPSDVSSENIHLLIIEATLFFNAGMLTKANRALQEAEEICEKIPQEFIKYKMLLMIGMSTLKMNKDNSLRLLKKAADGIASLHINPAIKNVFLSLFSCTYFQGNELEKAEYCARQLTDQPASLDDIKDDLLKLRCLPEEGEAAAADRVSYDPFFDFANTLLNNIPISVPKIFLLFLIAEKYLKNNKLYDALRVFSELYSLPEESLHVTFGEAELNLQPMLERKIPQLFSAAKKNKDFPMCQLIIDQFFQKDSDQEASMLTSLRRTKIKNFVNTIVCSLIEGNELERTKYYTTQFMQDAANVEMLRAILFEYIKRSGASPAAVAAVAAPVHTFEASFDTIKRIFDNDQIPKIFLLFLVADKYLDIHSTSPAAAIFTELNALPEASLHVTIEGRILNLKNLIDQRKTLMFWSALANKDFDRCQLIIDQFYQDSAEKASMQTFLRRTRMKHFVANNACSFLTKLAIPSIAIASYLIYSHLRSQSQDQ